MLVAPSCPTPCNPPVHGCLQARILEWVAISFSRGSSWHRDPIRVSRITGRFFTIWPPNYYSTDWPHSLDSALKLFIKSFFSVWLITVLDFDFLHMTFIDVEPPRWFVGNSFLYQPSVSCFIIKCLSNSLASKSLRRFSKTFIWLRDQSFLRDAWIFKMFPKLLPRWVRSHGPALLPSCCFPLSVLSRAFVLLSLSDFHHHPFWFFTFCRQNVASPWKLLNKYLQNTIMQWVLSSSPKEGFLQLWVQLEFQIFTFHTEVCRDKGASCHSQKF